jgi:hypothetical protein
MTCPIADKSDKALADAERVAHAAIPDANALEAAMRECIKRLSATSAQAKKDRSDEELEEEYAEVTLRMSVNNVVPSERSDVLLAFLAASGGSATAYSSSVLDKHAATARNLEKQLYITQADIWTPYSLGCLTALRRLCVKRQAESRAAVQLRVATWQSVKSTLRHYMEGYGVSTEYVAWLHAIHACVVCCH